MYSFTRNHTENMDKMIFPEMTDLISTVKTLISCKKSFLNPFSLWRRIASTKGFPIKHHSIDTTSSYMLISGIP